MERLREFIGRIGHHHHHGRSQDVNIEKLDSAMALIKEVRDDLAGGEPIPPSGDVVTTAEQFDAALAAVDPGGTIVCAESLVYRECLYLIKPVYIVSERTGSGRMTRDEPAPQFLGGIRVQADDVTLVGLEVRHPDSGAAILELSAMRPVLDRLRLLGDPTNGNKRGVGANGGAMTITRCYIDDIKRKGQDSQAILGVSFLAPGLMIDDCFLSAAGEGVMMGGDRSGSADRIPSQVTLQRSDVTKQEKWLTEGWQIKNAIEAKNVKGWTIQNCTACWAGTSEGQAGYIFVMTPRNQYGDEPWTTVEDVLVENVHARYGCGCINFMGNDSNAPSCTLTNVTFRNVQFDDIDKTGPCKMSQSAGAGRMFLFDRAPKGVTLEAITVNGQNMSASGYFIKQGAPPPTGLVLRNMKLCESKYGWKIDAGGQGEAALKGYCPDVVYAVTPNDPGATNVPPLTEAD